MLGSRIIPFLSIDEKTRHLNICLLFALSPFFEKLLRTHFHLYPTFWSSQLPYPISSTMAKSIRSKAKRKARIIKRTDSHYAVADAERVQRLHSRLTGGEKVDKESEEEEMKVEDGEDVAEDGEFDAWPSVRNANNEC